MTLLRAFCGCQTTSPTPRFQGAFFETCLSVRNSFP
eukprot:UN08875